MRVGGRPAGLDEESNSESFEVIKGWPVGSRIYWGPLRVASKWAIDWGLGEVGQEPPCGLLSPEGMNVIQTPWSHKPDSPEHRTASPRSPCGVDEGAGIAQSWSKLDARFPAGKNTREGHAEVGAHGPCTDGFAAPPSFHRGTSIAPLKNAS